MLTRIDVRHEPFNMAQEYRWLAQSDEDGAVVTFTGKVRRQNLQEDVTALTLEHYPGMTEKVLHAIVQKARQRWPLQRVTIIHRIGKLLLGEEIVLVGVSCAHRESAFAAAAFMMDYLKTQAPFWKKETTRRGNRWLDARADDQQAAARWQHS